MLTLPHGFLSRAAEACRKHGALLILDEVATGFGRTGTMFACQREGVTPDLMCVAKGLTGGYLPVAATLATDRIYDAFLGPLRRVPPFLSRTHLHRQRARLCRGARDARAAVGRRHHRCGRAEGAGAARCARAARGASRTSATSGRPVLMCGIELVADRADESVVRAGRSQRLSHLSGASRARNFPSAAWRRDRADAAAVVDRRRASASCRVGARGDRGAVRCVICS